MRTTISSKVGELELECSSTISSEVAYGTSEARPVSPEGFVRRLEVVRLLESKVSSLSSRPSGIHSLQNSFLIKKH